MITQDFATIDQLLKATIETALLKERQHLQRVIAKAREITNDMLSKSISVLEEHLLDRIDTGLEVFHRPRP